MFELIFSKGEIDVMGQLRNKRVEYIHDYYDLDDPFGRIRHEFFEGKRKYMESGSFEAIDKGEINKKSKRNSTLLKNFDFRCH